MPDYPQETGSWNKQIENRNFLSPIGFKMQIEEYPKTVYFAQSANIPGVATNTVEQQTGMGRPIPYEAFGLNYEPFNLTFLVDENLENYLIIHNWLTAIAGGRESLRERRNIEKNYAVRCDASLAVMNSNMQTNFFVTFKDMFPVSLNALEFNATIDGTEYATATAEFRYMVYNIETVDGINRTQLE